METFTLSRKAQWNIAHHGAAHIFSVASRKHAFLKARVMEGWIWQYRYQEARQIGAPAGALKLIESQHQEVYKFVKDRVTYPGLTSVYYRHARPDESPGLRTVEYDFTEEMYIIGYLYYESWLSALFRTIDSQRSRFSAGRKEFLRADNNCCLLSQDKSGHLYVEVWGQKGLRHIGNVPVRDNPEAWKFARWILGWSLAGKDIRKLLAYWVERHSVKEAVNA